LKCGYQRKYIVSCHAHPLVDVKSFLTINASSRQVADACECGNEPLGSVKCGEFLD